MKLAILLVSLVSLAACQTELAEECKSHPPYDDAKYEHWRQRAIEAGCDKREEGKPAPAPAS